MRSVSFRTVQKFGDTQSHLFTATLAKKKKKPTAGYPRIALEH